jgi:DNA-binding Lrp family transcriptional regulator
MDGCEFLEHCRFLKGRGVIRRFSAQIRHINVGFSSIMACWQVPSSSLEAVAKRITPFREVSHCCERKAHPLFPYNLFTVIHSGTKDNFREVAEKISREIDSDKYILLHTVREFKNERIKYFT